ncbi:2-succinyl-6-hydroxy-2, 4-cyclohexadiene-1-carboxylate synthase, partial [Haemophilus influenzae]
LHIKNC